MKKLSPLEKKRIKELNTHIKTLQEKLIQTKKLEGKDDYIAVKVKKNQGRFKRIKKKGTADKAEGSFYIEIDITAKQSDVFIPVSIASGKKTAGFMYQIEGGAEGSVATANVQVRGDNVSHVTVGTLIYAKIPKGNTASFEIRSTIRGSFGKSYKLVFTRLNYKLHLNETRYQQYLKEIHSNTVIFK